MSANTKNSSIFDTNTNENNVTSTEQSYDDLIGYCALRKQFARIIPSYYTEIQKQSFKRNNKYSNLEEYKKLKEEINNMKESIDLLKESKQKKLQQIEELRILMRKVGSKQLSYKEKKNINNNIINNYCSKEKSTPIQDFRCKERKGSNQFKASSDEGLSLAPTTSGLSSGKDDDAGTEEGGNAQANPLCLTNNSSSNSSWCFKDEENYNPALYLNIQEKDMPLPILKSN